MSEYQLNLLPSGTKKVYLAAYGSLRKGNYNFERFNANFPLLQYEETVEIPGFQLWDLVAYPYVVKSPNPDDRITIDILSCSAATKRSIDLMEFGAGYKEEIIIVNNKECSIYYFENLVANTTRIPHGDYNK